MEQEVNNKGDKDVFPVVPSFWGKVRLRWRGVSATKDPLKWL